MPPKNNEFKSRNIDLDVFFAAQKPSMIEIIMFFLNFFFILFGTMVFCFGLENVIFTTKYLTTSDISFFSPDAYLSLGTDWFNRLGVDWWMCASDILYVIVPTFQTFILIVPYVQSGSEWRFLNLFFLAFAFFVKLFTCIGRGVEWIWCYSYQICRNYNQDLCQSGNFGCWPNTIFIFLFISNVIFLIIFAIYGTLAFFNLYKINYNDYMKEFVRNIRNGKKSEEYKFLPKSYLNFAQGIENRIQKIF